jgi:hypothetical protein
MISRLSTFLSGLKKPGREGLPVWGALQPAGTTIVTIEPEGQFWVVLNVKVNLLPLVPTVAVVGEIVNVP